MLQKIQQRRRLTSICPADNNELHLLQLLGAWEPPDNSFAEESCSHKSSHYAFPMRNEKLSSIHGEVENIAAIRFCFHGLK